MDGNEIELKLAIAPEGVERLKRLPALRAHRNGRAVSKTLRSVYYDTPDQRLARAGITVRLRQTGDGLVQTVKTAGSRASGLFSRREWEAAVAGPGLDAPQLIATGLEPLGDTGLRAQLAPLFATDIRRTLHRLTGDGWQVEMVVDVGELRAGERTQPVCEVELELQEGDAHALFALARQIAAALPVRLQTLSKSDRGYALAAGTAPGPAKASPVALAADATLAEAFRAIARNCLHHLLANQDSLLDHGDGEAVHQMRVALRRFRSALKVFRPLVDGPQLATIRDEIAWLLDQLGPARDAEVFLSEIIDPVVERHPDHDGVRGLRERWQAECRDNLGVARAAVAESRFALLLLDLGAWVEAGDWCADPTLPGAVLGPQKLAPFARKVLDRLARKLKKAGGKRLDRLPPPALHHARIRGKQLRYAGEFFAPLYGKGAKDYLAVLGKLQDALGEINDIAVAGPRLASCHHLGNTAWAAGLVTGWHEARRPDLLASAEDLWASLRKHRKFWD